MNVFPAIIPILYEALPPEVNTSRLMAGAGAAPMLQASAGWEAFAILLESQADELAGSLAAMSAAWSGAAGQQAVTAAMPMVMWLRAVSLLCHERSLQAAAQAEAWSTAMATTPPLVEIELNHLTNAILNATNFLGINTVPIGLNELDYQRMREQAGAVMYAYMAATFLTTKFPPTPPPKPMSNPGTGAEAAALLAGTPLGAARAAARSATFSAVAVSGTTQTVGMAAGNQVANVGQGALLGRSQASKAESAAQQGSQNPASQQGLQMVTQMVTQAGSAAAQLPQQGVQMIAQPMQQFVQPLQQMTSLFSSAGADRAQIGLLGASPFSNHPLAGGTGASSGAGLVRAASLPGAGGTMARSPLMSNLIGTTAPSSPMGAAAGGSGAGLAPVGAGSGGGGPMGMHGQNKKSGGSRSGLATPSLLAYDTREEDDDEW